ncbi:MAG: hypothetical protein A2Y17_01980 [Clostridiales bacterium GWF2_38_85]|nr:MAG: hypothetical protein A2Y17_01980 [Clostridiales bacterium GWF2_38_85]HBL85333.1 hypothetical protein [Clostridiales bacterium]
MNKNTNKKPKKVVIKEQETFPVGKGNDLKQDKNYVYNSKTAERAEHPKDDLVESGGFSVMSQSEILDFSHGTDNSSADGG